MDNDEYYNVSVLDRSGETMKALALLVKLTD